MKIYMAAVAPPELLKMTKSILLSYYELCVTKIPFRKATFKLIKYGNQQKRIRKSTGESKTRAGKQGNS